MDILERGKERISVYLSSCSIPPSVFVVLLRLSIVKVVVIVVIVDFLIVLK